MFPTSWPRSSETFNQPSTPARHSPPRSAIRVQRPKAPRGVCDRNRRLSDPPRGSSCCFGVVEQRLEQRVLVFMVLDEPADSLAHRDVERFEVEVTRPTCRGDENLGGLHLSAGAARLLVLARTERAPPLGPEIGVDDPGLRAEVVRERAPVAHRELRARLDEPLALALDRRRDAARLRRSGGEECQRDCTLCPVAVEEVVDDGDDRARRERAHAPALRNRIPLLDRDAVEVDAVLLLAAARIEAAVDELVLSLEQLQRQRLKVLPRNPVERQHPLAKLNRRRVLDALRPSAHVVGKLGHRPQTKRRCVRDEAATIARLLERAHTPVPSGQPWVLSGPSVLLADVIHGIATAATDSYAAAWRNFTASPDSRNRDRLRIALDTAAATTATAIALARVQNDAPRTASTKAAPPLHANGGPTRHASASSVP